MSRSLAALLVFTSVMSAHATQKADPVFTDETGFTAGVSADGRLAAVFTHPFGRGTNAAPARIEIRNLRASSTLVFAGGSSPAGTPGRPAAAFSADGRKLAYTWLDEKLTDTGMLQVIDVAEGAAPRTIIAADPSDIGIIPHGWSRDGSSILVLIHGPSSRLVSDPTSIAWVSVADGSIRTVKTLAPWRGGVDSEPRLSPDGKWIAFSAVSREGMPDRSIFVMDANGGSERSVADIPGSNTAPVWTPDAARIVFRNIHVERGGIHVASLTAAPTARPERIEPPVDGEPIHVSTAGALYLRNEGGGMMGFVAGRGEGGRVQATVGGYGVSWREDMLAFMRGGRELVVRQVSTNAERVYTYGFLPIFTPRILRDRSAIVYVFPGADEGRPGGSFYRSSPATGRSIRLFGKDTPEHARSTVSALSADDSTLYLGVLAEGNRWSGVVGVNIATGQETRALTFPSPGLAVAGMAMNPEGTVIALHLSDGRIVVAPLADGGAYREIIGPSPGGGWRDVMRWSSDGRRIIFGERPAPDSTNWRLLSVDAAGGAAEPYGISSSMLTRAGHLMSVDLSPDGSRAVIGVRTTQLFDVTAVSLPATR
jgi:hypothetical protein